MKKNIKRIDNKKNWKKREERAQKLLGKRQYYQQLAATYKPSENGLSKAMETIHLYKIQISERQGGGEAIKLCLHFLLQNKVTKLDFSQKYKAALLYVLPKLMTGKIHRHRLLGKAIKTTADLEQLMTENLRASGISSSIRDFMYFNTVVG